MQSKVGEDGIFGTLRNLRSEDHLELKKANMMYSECVSKSFMPRWLKGEAGLQINEVCGGQYEDMMEKQGALYGEDPMPFGTLQLPASQI